MWIKTHHIHDSMSIALALSVHQVSPHLLVTASNPTLSEFVKENIVLKSKYVLSDTSWILIPLNVKIYEDQQGCKSLHHVWSMFLVHLDDCIWNNRREGFRKSIVRSPTECLDSNRSHATLQNAFSSVSKHLAFLSTLIPSFIKLPKAYCGQVHTYLKKTQLKHFHFLGRTETWLPKENV